MMAIAIFDIGPAANRKAVPLKDLARSRRLAVVLSKLLIMNWTLFVGMVKTPPTQAGADVFKIRWRLHTTRIGHRASNKVCIRSMVAL